MGAYLTQPDTTKNSQDSTATVCGKECQYAVTTMQGWRLSMEDCCIMIPQFDSESLVMGVFDGHGGREVAEYCTRHFERFIKDSKYYKDGQIDKAMEDAFLSCDKSLLSQEAQDELKKIIEEDVKCSDDEEEDVDQSEDELAMLEKEAAMPLDQVINKKSSHASSLVKSLTTIANKDLKKHGGGSSKQDHGASSSGGCSSHGDGSLDNYEEYLQKVISRSGVSLSPKMILSLFENDTSSESSEEEEEVDGESEDYSEPEDSGPEDSGGSGQDGAAGSNGESNKGEEEQEQQESHCKTDQESNKDGTANKKESQRELRKRRRDQIKEENSKAKRHQSLEDELPESNDMEGYECGTTAVVCMIQGGRYIVANAGDSRCILSTKGVSKNLSEDHKPTDPIEMSRIKKAGGYIDEDLRVNGGLNLSRAIGDYVYKLNESLPLQDQMISSQPDIVSADITDDDEFILLASDGIWNCTTSQDVVNFVRQRLINMKDGKPISEESKDRPQTLSLICEELCDMCLAPNTDNDGSGCDNMTVVLLLLQPLQSLFQ